MTASGRKFADSLTDAIRRIKIREHKTISAIQDELGYALGKKGGSSIEYWRKGRVPAKASDLEMLARELVQRGGLTTPRDLDGFVHSAGYSELVESLRAQLFPQEPTLQTSAAVQPSTVYHALPPIETLASFVVGVPIAHPRQFFGRQRELRRIFGLLRRFPLQNVALIGPRCSGKTSLLKYIQLITTTPSTQLRDGQHNNWLAQPESYRWLLVDFRDARMRTRQGLMQHILRGLHIPLPDPLKLEAFLDLISEHLAHSPRPTVILMDDIGKGLASSELDQPFWWSLRSLSSLQSNGNLAFILTSRSLPSQLAEAHGKPSPFFNMFGHTLSVGALSEREAHEFIANSPTPFAPADIEWIVSHSARWPSLLQILCHSRLMALEDGDTGNNWKEEGRARIARFGHLLSQKHQL